jgi:hypothetical protein
LQHEFLEFKKKKVQRKPFNSTKRKTIFLWFNHGKKRNNV